MPNILIVNTPGPQGPVGPQGIQGPSGSLASASSGSYSITGSLTISGSLETIGATSLTNVNISGSGNFTEDVNITGSLKFKGNTNNLYITPSTDVRNWYLSNNNFSVTSQESSPTGIYFKDDGTRFYIIGSTTDTIYQYDLSTPWDVSTAVYNSINLSVSAQDTAPTDLFISSDGTILFIVGNTNDRVYRYDLSSAWDISSATFVNFFSVTSEETDPNGLYFDPTGTNMYVVGTTGDDVNQYTLGTAWDLTTVSFLQTFSVASQETLPVAISFNNSGTRMYILGQTGDDINEYRLSTPWDISTATFFTTGFTFSFEGLPGGLYYNETYEVAYIVGTSTDTVYGLKATPQLKYYGDSFIMDSQMFVGGRTEIGGTLYSNGTITTPSTMVVGSTFSNVNSSFSSTIITLGTGTSTNTVNIGGNATLSSINQFAYGAITSSLTKTVNIGTGGLTGSITNTTIGSSLGGGKIILDQNTDFTQNTTINQTLNVNNNVNILDAAQTASGAIVVFDTFTETSNTLLNLHTPDTGSSWSRVQISTFTSPTMTVFGATDTAGPTTTVSNEGVIYRQDTVLTTPNYEVSVNLVTQDTGDDLLWLFARYQDVNNWYGVKWSTTQANCALVKRVGGTFTNIATLSVAPITGTTTLSIRVQDNLIVVLNGGNVVMAVLDTSIVDAGYAAIGGGNIGQTSTDDFDVTWKFDNFTVRNYVAGAQTSNIVGGLNITGSLNATSITGSFSGSANLTSLLASSALVTGNVTVLGTASINTLVVNQTQLSTGSNQLGDAANDTQTLFGTVRIPTGSLTVTGSTIISSSAATQLQVGSNLLFVSSSGNIGIGTTTPGVTLDVVGSIRANSFMFNSTTQTQLIRINSTTHLAFHNTGSVEVARFDNAGNWGFGITSPLAKLHISGTNALRMQSTGFDTFEWFFSAGTGIGFRNVTDGTTPFFVGGTDDIGIGTTLPQRRLHIDTSGSGVTETQLALTSTDVNNRTGILFASSSLGSGRQHKFLHRVNNPTAEWILNANAGQNAVWYFLPRDDNNFAVSILSPFNGGTAYLTTGISQSLFSLGAGGIANQHINISSSGRVGIGTTTPSTTLNVNGTTLLQGGQTTVRGSGTTSATTALRVENSSATDRLTILDDGTSAFNTNQLFISSSGFIGVGTTAVQATGNLIAARRDQDGATSISVVNGSNTTNSRSAVSVGVPGLAINMIAYPVSQSNTRLRDKGVILTDTGVLNGIGVYTITGSIELAAKFTSNLNQLVISDNGNIGIGTTTPTASLHISGASSANLLRIDSPASSNILFVTGSGRVGIGTATPSHTLTVLTTTRLSNILIGSPGNNAIGNTNSDTNININNGVGIAGAAVLTPSARLHVQGAGATSATTTFLIQNSTPTPLMTVLDNGQFTYTTPTMSLAASQSAYTISPIISASNTVGGQHYGLNITPTFFQTTASQTETAFRVAATFNQSSPSATSGSNIIADFGATSVGSQLTITDITSGSIYMVNDVSGLPILEATSDWTVNMYNFPNVVLQKTGSQVNINGTLRVSGSFILPLSQSTSPQTGSAYWSGSFLFVYDGTRYRSSSFA